MALKRKIITAGLIWEETVYSMCSPKDSPKTRAAKKKASSEAQRALNQKGSWQTLELELAANFPTAGSALVVTLSYDDDHMPRSRKKAQERFKYFLKKLREARRVAGLPEPVAFWAPEILTSDSGRWHHHLVLNNTGHDIDMIRKCWIYGTNIEIEKLRVDNEKNHETLARYLSKELRECQEYDAKPGLHGWGHTMKIKKPEIEIDTVPDDYKLTAPEGSTVLFEESRSTEYASWKAIKCRLLAGASSPTPKTRRHSHRRTR